MKPTFTSTRETITVNINGHSYTSRRESPNFTKVREAVLDENWEVIPGLCQTGKRIADWVGGEFTFKDNFVSFRGERIPQEMNEKMLRMAEEGKDPRPWMRFWQKLQMNPSFRSVQQLYTFLKNADIPISCDGDIVAYKYVTMDYKDCYTKKVDNSIGATPFMERNKVSDESRNSCDHGYHVGSMSYVKNSGVGTRIVVVAVHPRDVVRVPESDTTKMGVNTYRVLADWTHGLTILDSVVDLRTDLSIVHDADEKVEAPATDMAVLPASLDFQRLDALSGAALAREDRMLLRKYCMHLGIKGASKLVGGKEAMVRAILEVRPRGV